MYVGVALSLIAEDIETPLAHNAHPLHIPPFRPSSLQALQSEISQQQPNMKALSSLSHSMAANCSSEDSLLLGEKLAQLTSALKAVQRSAVGRRRVLSEGLTQAQGFAASWEEAMREVEEKQAELGQFEVVGVDIDTVKAQLDEYKVHIQ